MPCFAPLTDTDVLILSAFREQVRRLAEQFGLSATEAQWEAFRAVMVVTPRRIETSDLPLSKRFEID